MLTFDDDTWPFVVESRGGRGCTNGTARSDVDKYSNFTFVRLKKEDVLFVHKGDCGWRQNVYPDCDSKVCKMSFMCLGVRDSSGARWVREKFNEKVILGSFSKSKRWWTCSGPILTKLLEIGDVRTSPGGPLRRGVGQSLGNTWDLTHKPSDSKDTGRLRPSGVS